VTTRRDLLRVAAGTTLGAVGGLAVPPARAADPALVGLWSPPYPWPDVAVHLHLLPASTPATAVLLSHGREYNPETDLEANYTRSYVVGIPKNGAPLSSWVSVENRNTALFCSGHTFLQDGRLVTMGGHVVDVYYGAGDINVFDYGPPSSWSLQTARLNAGRWYPSVIALPDGTVLVAGGYMAGQGQPNPLPQIWNPVAGTMRNLTGALAIMREYPKLFVLADGRVVFVGPEPNTLFLDSSGAGIWRPGPPSGTKNRNRGTAVLYDAGKILIMGGVAYGTAPAVATAQVLDVSASPLAWRQVAPMNFARKHLNATQLPDGTVLVTGGSNSIPYNDASGAVHAAELWDPATETWTVLASALIPRVYHSTALLLPDGRVLSAGGGQPAADNWGIDNTTVEIFSPPYLFRGPRPRVTSASATVTLGGTIRMSSPDAATIGAVNLLRLGSVTHGFNMNQRIARLTFSTTATGLRAQLPANPNLVLPGHYLLFALNHSGVPSIGRVVRIDA
jgi:hypothetical protein